VWVGVGGPPRAGRHQEAVLRERGWVVSGGEGALVGEREGDVAAISPHFYSSHVACHAPCRPLFWAGASICSLLGATNRFHGQGIYCRGGCWGGGVTFGHVGGGPTSAKTTSAGWRGNGCTDCPPLQVVAATLVFSSGAAEADKAADPKKLKAEGDRAFRNEKYQEVCVCPGRTPVLFSVFSCWLSCSPPPPAPQFVFPARRVARWELFVQAFCIAVASRALGLVGGAWGGLRQW
jgi:hypothetical protein